MPVARLDVAAARGFALAADGSVITGSRTRGSLAVAALDPLCRRAGRTPRPASCCSRCACSPPRRRRCAAASPRSRIADGALTIYLHRGPRLIFGDGALPHAKWDAAAAVLADRELARRQLHRPARCRRGPPRRSRDPATSGAAARRGTSVGTPANAATVATALDPSLIQPSSSTSG